MEEGLVSFWGELDVDVLIGSKTDDEWKGGQWVGDDDVKKGGGSAGTEEGMEW